MDGSLSPLSAPGGTDGVIARSAPAASLADDETAAWEAYSLRYERTAYQAVIGVCAGLFFFWTFVDLVCEPRWWWTFLQYRLVVGAVAVSALLQVRRTPSVTIVRLLCLVVLALTGGLIVWGVLPRAAHHADYFLSFILLFCGSAAAVSWPIGYSIACFCLVFLAHLLSLWIGPASAVTRDNATISVIVCVVVGILGIHLRRRIEHRTFKSSYALSQRHRELAAALEDVRQTHARLAVAEKLGALGRVTAGVAHEINNPLTYVMGNTTFVLGELSEIVSAPDCPEPLRARLREAITALKEADQGSHRVRKIVRDLRSFSRVDDEISSSVDLRKILETSIDMTWNEIRHRAQLVRDFREVGLVRGVEGRLVQLFVNLILNAAQAIDEGHAEHNEIRLTLRPRPDGGAVVTVRDTGAGISSENLSRIFDPFFTTKEVGVGTGLGLSVCSGIAQSHGGDLRVDSELGHGTQVTVDLPQIGGASSRPPPAASSEAVRPARILVVDDEPAVGASLRRLLKEHRIEHCASGEEALARVRADDPFDVILCDVMMPEMTGPELYEQLRKSQPQLSSRVVFLTGGAFTAATKAHLERTRSICVEKPVERSELLRIIEQVRSRVA